MTKHAIAFLGMSHIVYNWCFLLSATVICPQLVLHKLFFQHALFNHNFIFNTPPLTPSEPQITLYNTFDVKASVRGGVVVRMSCLVVELF